MQDVVNEPLLLGRTREEDTHFCCRKTTSSEEQQLTPCHEQKLDDSLHLTAPNGKRQECTLSVNEMCNSATVVTSAVPLACVQHAWVNNNKIKQ